VSLFDDVRAVIVEQLGVKPDEVKPTASFRDDFGADSLDAVEFIMALEEKFGIEIPDDDAEKMQTVDDALKYIESKMNNPRDIEENEGGN
jgi:acyl carrier protein